MANLTDLLKRYQEGDKHAEEQLFEAVYEELRALARSYMAGERRNHTLQPTALVHEAYQKLDRLNRIDWNSRGHFYAIAAIQMRRVLVDHAKSKKAEKHGGGKTFVDIGTLDVPGAQIPIEILELHEVLDRLQNRDPRLAKIVICRYFAGMTFDEIAEILGVTEKTVRNEWKFGKTWFEGQLGRSPSEGIESKSG